MTKDFRVVHKQAWREMNYSERRFSRRQTLEHIDPIWVTRHEEEKNQSD